MDKSYKVRLIYLVSTVIFGGNSIVLAQESVPKSSVPACAVNMVEPTQSGAESEKIIELLRAITKSLADQDFVTMAQYMDENCSTYNEHTGKLVTGRDNIVADVKRNVQAEEVRLKVPTIGFTIDHPYARVTGDTATVNFVLVKEIGGTHPVKYESHCTDVFVKQSGQWKKLLFRGDDWKLVK